MDGATNNVTYVTPFGGEELSGSAPVGIAVNPTTNRIYFAGTPRGTTHRSW
jgi:DNA-binding beta-propeller fold protein YncE